MELKYWVKMWCQFFESLAICRQSWNWSEILWKPLLSTSLMCQELQSARSWGWIGQWAADTRTLKEEFRSDPDSFNLLHVIQGEQRFRSVPSHFQLATKVGCQVQLWRLRPCGVLDIFAIGAYWSRRFTFKEVLAVAEIEAMRRGFKTRSETRARHSS